MMQLRYTAPSKLSAILEILHKKSGTPTLSAFVTKSLWKAVSAQLYGQRATFLDSLVAEKVAVKYETMNNKLPLYSVGPYTFTEYGEQLYDDDAQRAYDDNTPYLGNYFKSRHNLKGEKP